jgi:hypothetical protein
VPARSEQYFTAPCGDVYPFPIVKRRTYRETLRKKLVPAPRRGASKSEAVRLFEMILSSVQWRAGHGKEDKGFHRLSIPPFSRSHSSSVSRGDEHFVANLSNSIRRFEYVLFGYTKS